MDQSTQGVELLLLNAPARRTSRFMRTAAHGPAQPWLAHVLSNTIPDAPTSGWSAAIFGAWRGLRLTSVGSPEKLGKWNVRQRECDYQVWKAPGKAPWHAIATHTSRCTTSLNPAPRAEERSSSAAA